MSSILNNKDIIDAHIRHINGSLEFVAQITTDGVVKARDTGKEFKITSVIVTKPDWDSSQVGIMLDSSYPVGMFENEHLLRDEIEDFIYTYINNLGYTDGIITIKDKEVTHKPM